MGTWRTKRAETAGELEATGDASGTTDGSQLVAGMMAKGRGDGLGVGGAGVAVGLGETGDDGLALGTLGCSLLGDGLPGLTPAVAQPARSADSNMRVANVLARSVRR
jgi:hypothetical protein